MGRPSSSFTSAKPSDQATRCRIRDKGGRLFTSRQRLALDLCSASGSRWSQYPRDNSSLVDDPISGRPDARRAMASKIASSDTSKEKETLHFASRDGKAAVIHRRTLKTLLRLDPSPTSTLGEQTAVRRLGVEYSLSIFEPMMLLSFHPSLSSSGSMALLYTIHGCRTSTSPQMIGEISFFLLSFFAHNGPHPGFDASRRAGPC
jgi:hypothetical protein